MTESDLDRWWREKWATAFQMKAVVTVDQDTDPSDVYEDDHRVARLEQFGDIVCPPAHELGVLWMGGHGGVGMVLSSPTYKPDTRTAGGEAGVTRGLYNEVAGTHLFLHGGRSPDPGRVEVKGASFIVESAGASILIDAGGGDLVMSNKSGAKVSLTGRTVAIDADTTTIANDTKVGHIGGSGGPPTVTNGPNIIIVAVTGNDFLFNVSFVATLAAGPTLFTVTFKKPYSAPPLAIITTKAGAVVLAGYTSTAATIVVQGTMPFPGPGEITVMTGLP